MLENLLVINKVPEINKIIKILFLQVKKAINTRLPVRLSKIMILPSVNQSSIHIFLSNYLFS